MTKSESIKEIASALAKAQKDIKPARFDKVNPHFKSRYASLTSVQEACKSALAEQGLSVVQALKSENGKLMLVTTLVHLSGEWMSSTFELALDKQNMQAIGSATSYARRYALAAIVGVVSDDDDDAESTRSHSPTNEKPKNYAPQSMAQHQGTPAQSQQPSVGAAFDVEPFTDTDHGDFGAKVIQVGKKYKGKTFDEVGPDQIKGFVNWVEGETTKSGKPPSGPMLSFLDDAYRFLSQRGVG